MSTATKIYWASTVLLCLVMGVGGVADIVAPPEVAVLFEGLGYPPYFATIVGTWKVLGTAALLMPGQPRLKEWAYAGFAFDLSGALFSHLAVGDPMGNLVAPIVLLGMGFVSWKTAPKGRTLS